MRLRIKENSEMEVKFENECFTISLGEDLIETREQFLEYMGHMFDEAIYNSLVAESISEREIDKVLTGGRGLRSKIKMMDEAFLNAEYDKLKELQEYVSNSLIE